MILNDIYSSWQHEILLTMQMCWKQQLLTRKKLCFDSFLALLREKLIYNWKLLFRITTLQSSRLYIDFLCNLVFFVFLLYFSFYLFFFCFVLFVFFCFVFTLRLLPRRLMQQSSHFRVTLCLCFNTSLSKPFI